MASRIFIDRFDTTGDICAKKLTYEAVKQAVLKAGRFSCFEATETPKRARLFTMLHADEELVTDNSCGYPWITVRAATAQEQQERRHKRQKESAARKLAIILSLSCCFSLGLCSAQVPGASMPMSTTPNAAWADQDAGLSWTIVTFPGGHQWFVMAGKDGIGYVIDLAKFPRTQPADFANPKANCAKVGVYEFGWDLGIDPCPVDMTQLNVFPGGKTRHIHAPIVQWHAPDGTAVLFFGAENSPVQAWRMAPDGTLTYVARGAEMASSRVASGMPGSPCTLSSNEGKDPILWCAMPFGDANRSVTTGRVIAYDVSAMTNGVLPTLWTGPEYPYSKFGQPVVWNGQVYVPNSNGGVEVYALAGAQ